MQTLLGINRTLRHAKIEHNKKAVGLCFDVDYFILFKFISNLNLKNNLSLDSLLEITSLELYWFEL